MDLAIRERVASEVLGQPVTDGSTMPCRFAESHSKGGGARDVRVCLTDDGGKLPTFFCFHTSCSENWRPLNKEMRSKIWYAEHGRKPRGESAWSGGDRVASEPMPRPPAPRKFSEAALKALWRPELGATREYFANRSAVDVSKCDSASFLKALYDADEKVLVFTKFASQGQYIFWPRRGGFRLSSRPDVKAKKSPLPSRGVDGIWFLAQPVDGKWHPNPRNPRIDGTLKLSRRSMESVTDWRFLVLESDDAAEDLWLCFLATLPLPISAIYTSGGRSIHALIKVDARSKAEWDSIKRAMVGVLTRLGADPGALSAVRLTRLPGTLRGSRKQKLLFLNPAPDPSGVAICDF
ncbi:MAG: hypothetical protein QM496_13830 [Verrucomicrobiota bacterium]